MIAVRLQPEMEQRLAALAKRTGRTKTFYIRQAIEEDLEDIYLIEQVLARNEPTRPLREFLNELGV